MSYHIIKTNEDIARAVQNLTASCPLMSEAHKIAGLPPLRHHQNSYSSVARIVTGQLLSVASARAIWMRVEALAQPFDPQNVLALDHQLLKKAGLSNAKIRTLKALASAIQQGAVDFAHLATQENGLVREQMMAVHGIGPWTTDIYIMFCLGRADGFAPGDIALANAVGLLKKSNKRPTPAQLQKMAKKWSPWRGVAARLLWHYYGAIKNTKTETSE
ncbi:MAG: DNA-3-methyladenine glycosylase 2 family protein [bacterium]|nr:DNA-3-methyladenine glycosylase 2 family protein [bacterium]